MIKPAQVREIVKPLLARNTDLALVKRMLVLKPIEPILRGLYIDNRSRKGSFTPRWAAVFLFGPGAHLTFNWGGRLYNRALGAWDITKPQAAKALVHEAETVALSWLRPIHTIEQFVAFTTANISSYPDVAGYDFRYIAIELARGDLASAKTI